MSAARPRRKSPARAAAAAPDPAAPARTGPGARLRELYFGRGQRAVRFRYGLLLFDLVTIAYIVASSFFYGHPVIEIVDVAFGLVILLDFAARMAISRPPLRELLHPVSIADLIAIVSFLAPLTGESFGFLRIIRALRLFRSYQILSRLQQDFRFFRRNREIVLSAVNLLVFMLIMTALVFETQIGRNPAITNYADALYFTVTTLTTTGFGDITLQGTSGRLLAVLIMIFGVSLFIRLAQTVFRPNKVHYDCPDCGLSRHDADAVHCKHCGATINIPTEGLG
ncbi:MAG TPA: ion transporter [Geminicoccaceae bacterium]|nr:ion transporter [Geminicoccaceae bacterium]